MLINVTAGVEQKFQRRDRPSLYILRREPAPRIGIDIITRHGKPVAQLGPPPKGRRKVRLGGMKDRIQFRPGWDEPVDLDGFLAGDS